MKPTFHDVINYDNNVDANNNGDESGGSHDKDEDCQHKLLWAAYVDPKYTGYAIKK